MFHSIWSKSLRDYRVAILGWGIGLGLLMIVAFISATPGVIATFVSIAPLLRFLGDGYALQTPEGYVTFRYLGMILPLLLSLWPILAGARLLRGEEERGTLDVLLATPQTRTRLLLEKVSVLLLALLLIALLFTLCTIVGEASIHHVDVIRALLTGLNLSLFAFFFGMVSLLLSQFTIRGGATAGGAGGLLVLALAFNVTGNEIKGSWIQFLSPFYYYDLNRPLITSFHDQPVAALLLVALSALCIAGSLILFIRRDIGRSAWTWQRKTINGHAQAMRSLSRAEQALSTRTVSLHTLVTQGWYSFWWLLGGVSFTVYCLLLTPGLQKPFYKLAQETPLLAQFLFDTPTDTNAALLGTIVFTFIPALVVVFALTLALKWSSDLENGRLELIFSTPQSRLRVLLERFGVNALMALLASILIWLVIMIGAKLMNMEVNQGRVLAASFSMFPPAFITLALVYALAGRLRYAAVLGILTTYLVLAYLEEAIEGMTQIPTWVMSLSIFHLYGNPIFLGMNWNNFLGMTAVGIALLIIALVQFRYADIERG